MPSTRQSSSPGPRGLDPLDALATPPSSSSRRRRVIEAAAYRRAVEFLDERDYLDGEERAALLDDAEAEIAAAVTAAAIPADPTQRRIQREARERS
jgi:hypothetical protein